MSEENTKQSSEEVASVAAKALNSEETSELTKKLAGSVLSQAKPSDEE
ncbi:MAG: hypothetical protein Q4C71_02550 [Microbacteriaceae bacterium]|nr:hypothetical protein [Microbacteriaceae bacterium]